MTKATFVRAVSRVIALYLLIWALADCTYLPQYLHSYVHHRVDRNIFIERDYWTDYYLIEIAFMLVRIFCLLLGTAFFWKAGPTVARLLSLPEDGAEKQSEEPNFDGGQ